jgi:hypothetical protein
VRSAEARVSFWKTLPPAEVRCEGETKGWTHAPAHTCTSRRSIEINGKKLCGQHAQKEALALMIKDGRATVLQSVPAPFGSVKVASS